MFVLPSRRSGTFLKHYLAQKTKQTIFAPQIFSIENFIEDLSGISYSDSTELLFTLYYAYLDVIEKDREPLVDFAKWARTLLMDFDEIDRHLVPHKSIFSYLSSIREIDHWYLQPDKTQLMRNYIAFWQSLEPMYSSFAEKLLSRKKGHQGLVYRKAHENLSDYLRKSKNKQHIFLGFNALNTAESHIIQAILSETPSRIYWDIDRYFIDSAYHDAGYFIRKHLKTWHYYRKTSFPLRDEGFTSSKEIHITGVPKNVSQAKYIGQLLENILDADPSDLNETAVILGDESLLNPLLNALPPSIDKVNVTMGFPLRNAPIAGLFEQFFELYLKPYPRGWPYKMVLSIFSLPQIQLILQNEEKDQLKTLQKKIHRHNLLFLSQAELGDLFGDLGNIIFNRKNDNVPDFIKNALRLIETMRSSFGEGRHTLVEEHLFGFYTIFNQLFELSSAFPYVKDIRTLHSLFVELLAEKSLDFQGEPLQGLQIMGMLESRVLDFKNVIISSVNEGILPSGKQVNSFIPYDLKKEFGLPTYKEKDAVYTYHFYRLLQRANQVHIVYNTEPDVLMGGEPSRFVYQLCTDHGLTGMVEHKLATMEIDVAFEKPQQIHKSDLLMSEIAKYASDGFSPTSLAQYIRNPLDFYKKFILKIDDSQVVEETIAANTFGTIIHNGLEELLSPFVGDYLNPDKLKAIRPDVEQVITKHFTNFYDESSIRHGKNSIAFQVLIRTLTNFLDFEIKQAQSHEIKLLELEKKMDVDLEVPGITFPIKLKGKVDRIDEKNGRLRIIDYKTGSADLSQMNVVNWEDLVVEPQKSKAFQVLCYSFMRMQNPKFESLEAGIISLKNLRQGFLAFATKEKKSSRSRHSGIDSDTLILFKEQLFDLLREICNPAIPFTERME